MGHKARAKIAAKKGTGTSRSALKLIAAITKNDLQRVRELIADGADINGRGSEGARTPLMFAAGRNLKMVELLLKNGAEPNELNDYGGSALTQAANAQSVPRTVLLLDSGADPNLQDDVGRPKANSNCPTALMTAAACGACAVVRLLVDRGAKIDATNCSGHTALMYATTRGQAGSEVVALLIDLGASLDLQDSGGATALASTLPRAVHKAKLLIERGANVDLKDKKGKSPRSVIEAQAIAELIPLIGGRTAKAQQKKLTPSKKETPSYRVIDWKQLQRWRPKLHKPFSKALDQIEEIRLYDSKRGSVRIAGDFLVRDFNVVIDGNLIVDGVLEMNINENFGNFVLVTGNIKADAICLSGFPELCIRGDARIAHGIVGVRGDDGGFLDILGTTTTKVVVADSYFNMSLKKVARGKVINTSNRKLKADFTERNVEKGVRSEFLDGEQLDGMAVLSAIRRGEPILK